MLCVCHTFEMTLDYAKQPSATPTYPKMMTKFRFNVVYLSTKVTDLIMSQKLILQLALSPSSSLAQARMNAVAGGELRRPYFIATTFIARSFSLRRQNVWEDEGIMPHYCTPVENHSPL